MKSVLSSIKLAENALDSILEDEISIMMTAMIPTLA